MKKLMVCLPALVSPQYILLAVLLPISAYMLINETFPGFDILPIIISLSFAVCGFNIFNMVFDCDLDRIVKPKRPIPSGMISKVVASRVGWFFYLLALFSSFLVNLNFSLLIIAFIVLSYFYSSPPFRTRNFVLGSSVNGAILYGAIPYLSVQSISGYNQYSIIYFLFFVFLLFIISNTKDFEDSVGERNVGVRSLATMLGDRIGAISVIFSEFFLLGLMALFSLIGVIPEKFIYATIFSVFILIFGSYLFWKSVLNLEVRNNIVRLLDAPEFKDYVFQADGVTISILLVTVIPLVFGLVSLVDL